MKMNVKKLAQPPQRHDPPQHHNQYGNKKRPSVCYVPSVSLVPNDSFEIVLVCPILGDWEYVMQRVLPSDMSGKPNSKYHLKQLHQNGTKKVLEESDWESFRWNQEDALFIVEKVFKHRRDSSASIVDIGFDDPDILLHYEQLKVNDFEKEKKQKSDEVAQLQREYNDMTQRLQVLENGKKVFDFTAMSQTTGIEEARLREGLSEYQYDEHRLIGDIIDAVYAEDAKSMTIWKILKIEEELKMDTFRNILYKHFKCTQLNTKNMIKICNIAVRRMHLKIDNVSMNDVMKEYSIDGQIYNKTNLVLHQHVNVFAQKFKSIPNYNHEDIRRMYDVVREWKYIKLDATVNAEKDDNKEDQKEIHADEEKNQSKPKTRKHRRDSSSPNVDLGFDDPEILLQNERLKVKDLERELEQIIDKLNLCKSECQRMRRKLSAAERNKALEIREVQQQNCQEIENLSDGNESSISDLEMDQQQEEQLKQETGNVTSKLEAMVLYFL